MEERVVLLITGSSGIAAATARLAVLRSISVFLAAKNQAECEALAASTGARWHAADLVLAASADQAVSLCLESYGRLDALFNVAGISGRRFGDGPIHACTEEGWDATLDNNAKSMFLMCRAAIRHWLSVNQPGVILNMASVSAYSPEPRHFAAHAYAASKGAVIAMTKAMAAYYAPRGIRINAIAPGLVRTPMSARAQASGEILEFMKTKQPLAPLLDPDDIARASLFLLSDEARHMTGQVIAVDAGWSVT